MDELNHSNIYFKCTAKVTKLISTDHFNTDQHRALKYVKTLSNEVRIITKSTTIDKTQFILNILQTFLFSRNADHSQMLICTPNIAAADDLTRRLYSQSQENEKNKNAVIIRMHSVSTEKEVLNAAAVSTSITEITTCDVSVHHVEKKTELPLLNIASMIFNAYVEPYKRTHGVKDMRYTLHKMSLATWMMRIVELLTADDPVADIKRHDAFRFLYNQQRAGVDLDESDKKSFETARQALREHTSELAHVVVTTASNRRES
jgi:hypothetical protein